MIQIQTFTFNDFQENTYVLYDDSLEAVIFDPGCYRVNEQMELKNFIETKGLKPVKLVNTHCHIDHILGNDFVRQTWNLKVQLHEKELFTYRDAERWTVMFGLPPLELPAHAVFIDEGQKLCFGNSELDILLTPGHSIASLSFYNPTQNILIAGDVLFYESIGRSDLPGGHYETLIDSIQNKLFTLPDETIVYPGHGPQTHIGHEKENNPFLQATLK